MLRLFTGLCLVLFPRIIQAQFHLESSFHVGQVLRIHPDYPSNTQRSWILQAGVSKRLSGKKAWHHLFGHPEWGLNGYYYSFGNPEILGQAFSITPHLAFRLAHNNHLHFQIRIGMGLAYLNKPHHPVDNPENNAISSHLNNLTSVEFRLILFPQHKLQPFLGLMYSHFSNANSSVPNLGINVPTVFAGLRFKSQEAGPKTEMDPLPEEKKLRIRPGIRIGYGSTENKVSNGPSYPVWVGAFYLNTTLSHKYRILLGTEWFFSYSVYDFLINEDKDVENPAWASTGIVLFTGGEVMLGHWAISGYLGPYVKQAALMPFSLYTKLGLAFHFADQQHKAYKHPYAGVYVHSHSGEADFLEFGLGYLF